MWLCGNFHNKPETPFYPGLNLPPNTLLSVNQLEETVREAFGIGLQKYPQALDALLEFGPEAIDELTTLMSRFNTTPDVLLNLLSKEGMSVAELKNLLELQGADPELLLTYFNEGKTLDEIKALLGNAIHAPISQRLQEYFRRIREAPPARSAEEALQQVRNLLNQVEDDLSGIPRQDPPPPPNMPDGRMYPPLDDYTTRHPDGSITARSRGHRVDIGSDGSITITNRKSGQVEISKPGASQ